MKKCICYLIFVSMILAGVPAYAANGEYFSDYGIYFDASTGTVTGSDKEITSVTIPEEINGSKVLSIGYSAFAKCMSLSEINIPDTVETISQRAFFDCDAIEEVTIPLSVRTMSNYSFLGCDNLKTINGYKGSAAETFAAKTGIRFNSLAGPWTGTKKTGTSAVIRRKGEYHDLLNEHQVFGAGSGEAVSVFINPDWHGNTPGRILITQGGINYIESNSGNFINIKPGDIFDTGSGIYIVLITGDGITLDIQRIKMQIVAGGDAEKITDALAAETVSILEKFEVDVPESVPIAGGSAYGLDMDSLKTAVTVDGNIFRVVIASEIPIGFTDDEGSIVKDRWNTLKNLFRQAKTDISNGEQVTFPGFEQTKFTMTAGTNDDDGVSVAGYIEGCIDDDGKLRIFEGGIIVSGEYKYSYEGMVVVGPIPMYYEIGAGGGVALSAGIRDNVPDDGLGGVFTGSITPSLFLEAGAGVGVPYALTAGTSGRAELALEIALDRVYRKMTLEGSAKFQWKGPFNVVLYEREFAYAKWYIYETGNPNTLLGAQSGLFSAKDIYNDIDLDAPVKTEERSYTQNREVWQGGAANRTALKARSMTGSQITVLEQNSYIDAAPVSAYMGDTLVLAWITDNTDQLIKVKP